MKNCFPQWAIGPFTKYDGNPVLVPSEAGWDNTHVSNVAMSRKDGKYCMVYRAEREKDLGICLIKN